MIIYRINHIAIKSLANTHKTGIPLTFTKRASPCIIHEAFGYSTLGTRLILHEKLLKWLLPLPQQN